MKNNIAKSLRKSAGVYKISNNKNKLLYIGSSVKLQNRYRQHLHGLNNKKHFSNYLQNFVNKHGIDCLSFDLLEICEKEDCTDVEQKYLDIHKPFGKNGFNTNPTALNSTGLKRTKESIYRAVKTKRENGVYLSISINMSKNNKGNTYMLGKKHSEKTKKKISEKSKGKVLSNETKEKIRIASTGRTHSEKVKKDQSKRMVGNKIGVGRVKSKKEIDKISLGNSKKVIQKTLSGEYIKTWNSFTEASLCLGISKGNMSSCANKNRKNAGGFIWEKK